MYLYRSSLLIVNNQLQTNDSVVLEWDCAKLKISFHSVWSCASDEELKQAQLEWKRRQKEGTTHEIFEERNKMMKKIGESTTVIAYK